MPLILAVAPNTSQVQQLTSLVRQYLQAELVTAPSGEAALQALGNRIPDLILTPALLAPKDESALTERLRELGTAAAHVQTLAVPILASGKSKSSAASILGRKRDKSEDEEPVGCHPSVFAEQIQIYLDRAANERASATASAAPAGRGTLDGADTGTQGDGLADDDLDVIFDMPIEPLTPPVPPARPDTAPPEVVSTLGAETPHAPSPAPAAMKPTRPAQTRAAEELGLTDAPSGSPPLWRITEEVEDFYRGTASFAAPAEVPETQAESPAPLPGDGPAPEVIAARAEDDTPATDGPSDEAALEVDLDEALAASAALTSADLHTASPATVDAGAGRSRATQPPVPAPQSVKGTPAKAARKKSKHAAPPSDDWIYFDPSQPPFRALVRRLEEIAGQTGTP